MEHEVSRNCEFEFMIRLICFIIPSKTYVQCRFVDENTPEPNVNDREIPFRNNVFVLLAWYKNVSVLNVASNNSSPHPNLYHHIFAKPKVHLAQIAVLRMIHLLYENSYPARPEEGTIFKGNLDKYFLKMHRSIF